MLYLSSPPRRYVPNAFRCLTSTRYLRIQSSSAAERFRILFMGRDEFSCLVFRELFKAKDLWSEVSIVTQPDMHVGRRGSILSVSPLRMLGESLDVPIHTIPKMRKEFKSWQLPEPFVQAPDSTQQLEPSHLLVTASFGRILTGAMLDAFQPTHRLNVHPSLLPAYRGPAPIQHAIMNEDKETGVCIIKMLKRNEGIDAGAFLGCRRTHISDGVNFTALRDKLGVIGGELLVSVLRELRNGEAIPREQGSAISALKAPAITSADAAIDFHSMSASQIEAKWRGISHQKPLYTHTPDDKQLQLHALSVLPTTEFLKTLPSSSGRAVFSKKHGSLIVNCLNNTLLGVARVKAEGKAEMSAREWWNGAQGIFCAKEGPKEICMR